MIVVSDTTPLNYLIQIHVIDVLPALYGRIHIPPAVREELAHPRAPEMVRAWITAPPQWLVIHPLIQVAEPGLTALDIGERDAILLAEQLGADQLIIDEIQGRREAHRRKRPYTGTLGILSVAAERDLLDLREAVERLHSTTFHISEAILTGLLKNCQ